MKKKHIIYWLVGVVLPILLYIKIVSPESSHPKATVENAIKMLDEQLRRDYGEEFVIYGLGKRSAGKETFYEGKIIPKSKIGTPEEEEYKVNGYVDIKRGRLVGSGDMYGLIAFEKNTEEYFQKLLEEHFGKYVRAKTNVGFDLVDQNNKGASYRTLGTTFEKSVETLRLNKEPKLMLTQFIYIFTRKLSKREKDVYREKIWSYVEMLKEKGMYDYTMLEINFVDERILSNNFEELEKSMFSDLGERKKGFYRFLVEYPTNKSKNKFVKKVAKSYNITSEKDKLFNLHKFKMKEREELYKQGNFGDYYTFIKTSLISKKNLKGYIKIFGKATKAKEIIYWDNNIFVFKKGGKNE